MGPDGVAPASALLEDAAIWSDEFEREIRAEARRLGLTRDRWPRGARSLYRLAALAPGDSSPWRKLRIPSWLPQPLAVSPGVCSPSASTASSGRRLAYGAVFGAAPAAVAALSPPPKDRAWSSYGGRWRLVRIGSHSERIPPVLSLYLAVLFGLVGLFFLLMVVRLGLSVRHDDGLALAAGFVPP